MTASPQKPHIDKTLRLIGIFKLLNAVVLVGAAIGLFHLVHKSLGDLLWEWVDLLNMDPDNRIVASILDRADLVDPHRMRELGYLTGVYALLFVIEGTGLCLGKRWAEWLTVFASGSLIPLEIFETIHKPGPIKMTLIAANVAIVIYLCYHLWKKMKREGAPAAV